MSLNRNLLKTFFCRVLLSLVVSFVSLDVAAGPPNNRPPREGHRPGDHPKRHQGPQDYSIEQAVSDEAQLHTIAFSGLAFITGGYGPSTFIPPGKVCDFFGFQYMRDIDKAGKGHSPVFLDRVAGNILYLLNDSQRTVFRKAAQQEAEDLRTLAKKRLPLIKAFCRELNGDIPEGSRGLNKASVVNYVGDIFAFDAQLSYRRAQVFGKVVRSLTQDQKAYISRMAFGDFNTWPARDVEKYKLPRGTEKRVNIAYILHSALK